MFPSPPSLLVIAVRPTHSSRVAPRAALRSSPRMVFPLVVSIPRPTARPVVVPTRTFPASPRAGEMTNENDSNGGVQVLHNPARQFDGNYGPVARGTAPAQQSPAQPTHQQNLGSALGIAANRGRGGFPSSAPRGGFQSNGVHQVMTPAMRGAPGGIRNGVPLGRGVGIPPPAGLNGPSVGRGGSKGRGVSRGAPRGGRGGLQVSD